MFQVALCPRTERTVNRTVFMRTPQSGSIGSSDVIRGIAEEMECAARSDAGVLITGEQGVGKKMIARMIHERSRRGRSPFVPITCAGVADSVLESELFGHLLEQAHGGTIVLDEIGEMSPRIQARLLRFLEKREIQRADRDAPSAVDVRLIATSTRNLLAQVAEKPFSEDLYYRLNVFHIPIPPLRDRRDDISTLFSRFVRSHCEQYGVPEPVISEAVIARLVTYDWPGNVGELKNAALRMVVQCRGEITEADLPALFDYMP